MKLLITGSRKYDDYEKMKQVIEHLAKVTNNKITMLLHGGAKGADTLAQKWADENKVKTQVIKPDYDKHGKVAPLIRNKELVKLADVTLAFYSEDERTGGTGHTATQTINAEKPLYEIFETEKPKLTAPASKLF